MPIRIPPCDPFMDADCSGNGEKTIPFKRSRFMKDVTPRDHVNSITGWVDGSNVYGSTEEVADRLRTFSAGQMKEG